MTSTAPDSEHERVVITYEGQDYELVPSLGEVICPGVGTTIHHRQDCWHLNAADQTGWRRYPDTDGLTWRRLIDSVPSRDATGRADFAVRSGLLNGAGRPVTGTCSRCVLQPLSSRSRNGTRRWTIDEALAAVDRTAWADDIHAAEEQIARVQTAFPEQGWTTLPLNRYALGLDEYKESFCYLMEFQTPEIGSIRGGSALKHIIYYRRNEQRWHFDNKFNDAEHAWAALRDGFQEALALVTTGNLTGIDGIDVLRGGPALVAKTIFVYHPDRILPIYSRDHIRHFIRLLGGDEAHARDPFEAHEQLKRLVEEDGRFTDWHPLEIIRFLYWWADPRPSQSIVKIAPGEKGTFWQDCLEGGYICVGWDEVGDLSRYSSEEEFHAAFRTTYLATYNGSQAAVTTKAKELWRLAQLQPGDLIVANKGTGEILGVGTVTGEAYIWRPERPEYRHTVSVTWDVEYAQQLPEPEKRWAMVTVADISAKLWRVIGKGAGSAVPSPERVVVPPASPPEPLFIQLSEALERKGQAVVFGPPGTGKTYTCLRFALWWLGNRTDFGLDPMADYGTEEFRHAIAVLAERGNLTQLTFHPAYAYEDFIEGFRPVSHESTGLQLALTDGVFKRICHVAREDPEHPYLLFIDEINRGDMPKVFGELITLIEKDKRGIPVVLPQSGQNFQVPDNVHILGSMNTADRSIRMLDSALRRRFAFIEIMPDARTLEGERIGSIHLADLLRALNLRVLHELGRERQIGHSCFLPKGRPVDTETELAAVIRGEVLPLLQEYAYDDYNLLAKFVGNKIVDTASHQLAELTDEELLAELCTALGV